MFALNIRVDSADTRAALQRLKGLGSGHELFDKIGQNLKDRVRAEFYDGTDPFNNAWAPLSPATVKRRGGTSEPLMDKGDLMGSAGAIASENGMVLSVGEGLPDGRAWYAQYGTDHEPQRMILPEDELPADWLALIMGPIDEQFLALAGGS